jgi:hypothetical protein
MVRTLILTLGAAMAVLGVMAPLATAVPMRCGQEAERFLASATAPPTPVRKDCVVAQSLDGQTFPVKVQKAKSGDKLNGLVKEGKAVCANLGSPLSAEN